jgi:hypothetical protein
VHNFFYISEEFGGNMRVVLSVIFIIGFIFQPSTGNLSQSAPTTGSLSDMYGVGGGGTYDPTLSIHWWRDWDGSYNDLPGVNGRPANKMWTVGKIDHRVDGPAGSNDTSRANIDQIFQYEKVRIQGLIQKGFTGQYWEIANEPNWAPYFVPADYAYEYHLFCGYIKSLNPTAKCLNGGLVLLATNWPQWLEEFRVAYNSSYGVDPPIDVWNIHPYGIFDQNAGNHVIDNIRQFRSIKPNGKIWITEFSSGGWTPVPEADLVKYINVVCGWLNQNYALYNIERWFWWGVLTGNQGMGSNGLFTASPYSQNTITPVGTAYLQQRSILTLAYTLNPNRLYLPLVVR